MEKFENLIHDEITRKEFVCVCLSCYETGDQDFLKEYGTELLDSYVDPLVIRHPKGHTIPRFGNDLTLIFVFLVAFRTMVYLNYVVSWFR